LPKSHRRLYFQLLAVEKGVKMFSQLHYLLYFAPAAFYLFLKVKSELASCVLTQGTFKKSLKGVAPTSVTEKLAAAVLE
jgi:hypothetical protein